MCQARVFCFNCSTDIAHIPKVVDTMVNDTVSTPCVYLVLITSFNLTPGAEVLRGAVCS